MIKNLASTTKAELSTIPIAIVLIGGLLLLEFSSYKPPVRQPVVIPDFALMTDVKLKKRAFFEFMLPIIRDANEDIRQERAQLEEIHGLLLAGKPLSEQDRRTTEALAKRYRIAIDNRLDHLVLKALLKRADIIPVSLALAQAANESAWGTTRFAKTGNNFFGIWCFRESCGMVPTRRNEEARHEVARFNSVAHGAAYYLLNLNRHPAYQELRDIREVKRKHNAPLKGMDLAPGLVSYSERAEAYTEEIQAMIRINKLEDYARINRDH